MTDYNCSFEVKRLSSMMLRRGSTTSPCLGKSRMWPIIASDSLLFLSIAKSRTCFWSLGSGLVNIAVILVVGVTVTDSSLLQYSSVKDRKFDYHVNTRVTEIIPDQKVVKIASGSTVPYDILILATGSDAFVPQIPGHDAKGVFVYRTLSDLTHLIDFASVHRGQTAITIGGGLLGLEAAKAMRDLQDFSNVKIIDRNKWLLARQLDSDAGTLVSRKVRDLGVEVLHNKSLKRIDVDGDNNITGVTFTDGEGIDCCCVCFAVSCLMTPSLHSPCNY